MAGKHEITELVQVLSGHIDKRAANVHAPHRTDFGLVLGQNGSGEWIIRIRGKGIELPSSQFYWSQYFLPDIGWVDVVPKEQLSHGDRLALTATDGEYTVVGRVMLG